MEFDFKGKIAFISGSTAGIGMAIAQRLGHEGADIVINGRTEDRVRIALGEIKKEVRNVDVRGIAADLGTAAGQPCDSSRRGRARRFDQVTRVATGSTSAGRPAA